MASLVLELQREALNSTIPVTDLLRKALVVATELSIKEFQAWIEYELNGYANLSGKGRRVKPSKFIKEREELNEGER
jgi:hypothetical protein